MAPNDTADKTSKSSRDRWIKIGFVLILIAVAIAIYSFQRRDLHIEGWGNDLNAALAQAKAENRKVVAFFVSSPPSDTAKEIAQRRISKADNQQALKDGNFILVIVTVDSNLDSDPIAQTYKLTKLPTLMVLLSDGTERNRNEGGIGEVDFRQQLLRVSSTAK